MKHHSVVRGGSEPLKILMSCVSITAEIYLLLSSPLQGKVEQERQKPANTSCNILLLSPIQIRGLKLKGELNLLNLNKPRPRVIKQRILSDYQMCVMCPAAEMFSLNSLIYKVKR